SIKEMATKLHIDESTYAMLERGEIKISAKRVDELLVVFSMSYGFLDGIENRLSQLGN
nr:helix-turn-helix transcriptional regulator [Bacteroidia bacterium]